MTTTHYIPPADQEMFRMGRKELKQIAAGKSARAKAAQAELDRRTANKKRARS